MDAWIDIVWFVVWAVVILVGVGLLIWAVIAGISIAAARRISKDFDKGFESDFFKRHRNI